MLPNERGPDLYEPMLLRMVSLMPHSILSGTFAKIINNLQRIKFAQIHLSYLDMLNFWLNEQPPLYVDCRVPKPFSPFADQFGYCGVQLRPSLLVELLQMFMVVHKKCMQASFQLANDKGCSTDDSFKLTCHRVVDIGKKRLNHLPLHSRWLAWAGSRDWAYSNPPKPQTIRGKSYSIV